MNIFNWILFGLGIILLFSILMYFIITEIKSSVFNPLGFIDSKEKLYDVTFEKFNFDYSTVSGIDKNENQENLISSVIKQIDVKDTPIIEEVDYYA